MTEVHFQTGRKKVRGRAAKTTKLIATMAEIAEACAPISVRGVAYKLFTQGLIRSMEKAVTGEVSRLLKQAREEGIIPWGHIVDETRTLARVSSWKDPAGYIRAVRQSYRRDFWAQQPRRVEVWSEKGTVRGVLTPVLVELGVGFRVMHGFGSATTVYDIAQDGDGRSLIALYVGDFDPSGMFMSEQDLPARLEKYGGCHVELRRIALLRADCTDLPSFQAEEKEKDPRLKWFVERYGRTCWELDAMDPNDLRDRVEEEIKDEIEPEAWERCEVCQEAEQESLQHVLDKWGAVK